MWTCTLRTISFWRRMTVSAWPLVMTSEVYAIFGPSTMLEPKNSKGESSALRISANFRGSLTVRDKPSCWPVWSQISRVTEIATKTRYVLNQPTLRRPSAELGVLHTPCTSSHSSTLSHLKKPVVTGVVWILGPVDLSDFA